MAKSTLRNFKIDDELFFQYEFVAAQNKRTVTAQLTEDIKAAVDEFKRNNPKLVNKSTGRLPMTDDRMIKQGI